MPYAMFIDRQGRLAYAHEAYASGDEVAYEKLSRPLQKSKRKRPCARSLSPLPHATVPASVYAADDFSML